ncbi:hypothetical protein VTJ04DRAFT_6176 [Mycothermus thermophilus]|uniref:uncharacterized protein n=1 Tax=Humicola insolens TaxID=85995 RepID=UPI003744282E
MTSLRRYCVCRGYQGLGQDSQVQWDDGGGMMMCRYTIPPSKHMHWLSFLPHNPALPRFLSLPYPPPFHM